VISVIASSPGFQAKADELARRLELPRDVNAELFLVVGERLELREANAKTGPVYVDFQKLAARSKQSKDLIAKAVGVKGTYRPTVIDATAGLGQDAFTLASYGCRVVMLERSKVVHALLEDGLQRAKEDKNLSEMIARTTLECADAKTALKKLEPENYPEVIFLDPMYPDLGKTAAKRKEMRLFREVVGEDADVTEVFEVARKTASNRVVVKRPLKAPELAKPSFSLSGKTIRFDVYVSR
jgi:16S rRNA (guanine1516-N2)-methyltransferase